MKMVTGSVPPRIPTLCPGSRTRPSSGTPKRGDEHGFPPMCSVLAITAGSTCCTSDHNHLRCYHKACRMFGVPTNRLLVGVTHSMREHLATLVPEFRRYDREIAVVRYPGIRRRVSTYGDIARLAGRFATLLAN